MDFPNQAARIAMDAELSNAFEEIAKSLGKFRKSLTAEGFTRAEALELCILWFHGMFGHEDGDDE